MDWTWRTNILASLALMNKSHVYLRAVVGVRAYSGPSVCCLEYNQQCYAATLTLVNHMTDQYKHQHGTRLHKYIL
jgi:hypothetical protein